MPIDGTIVIGEGERDEAPMLYIGEKVGLVHAKDSRRRPAVRRGRHRRRSARRHEPVRDRRAERDRGAGGVEQGRPAARARPLHGEAGRRAELEGQRQPRRAGAREPQGDRQLPRPRRRGSGRHRARPRAAREADRRHPRDRRAHPADRRRRSVGRHRRRGRRLGRARGDGHRRRAGRRADGGRDALPERRDLRAPRGQQAGARGALPRDGDHRLQEGLPLEGSRARRATSSSPRPASPTAR